MADLVFEPYAALVRWALPEPADGDAWGRVVGAYLEALAARCERVAGCVIGHIKGFAPMPGGYLRANVTSSFIGADVEVRSAEPVAGLVLTLNLLVYGFAAAELARLATDAATEVASTRGGTATLVERE